MQGTCGQVSDSMAQCKCSSSQQTQKTLPLCAGLVNLMEQRSIENKTRSEDDFKMAPVHPGNNLLTCTQSISQFSNFLQLYWVLLFNCRQSVWHQHGNKNSKDRPYAPTPFQFNSMQYCFIGLTASHTILPKCCLNK